MSYIIRRVVAGKGIISDHEGELALVLLMQAFAHDLVEHPKDMGYYEQDALGHSVWCLNVRIKAGKDENNVYLDLTVEDKKEGN